MSGKRITNRVSATKAKAGSSRHRRARRPGPEVSAWLGAGALTLGVGAVMASGSAVAHADTTHPGVAASTSPNGPAAAAGPKAGSTAKTSHAARTAPGAGAARPTAAPASTGVSLRSVPATRPVVVLPSLFTTVATPTAVVPPITAAASRPAAAVATTGAASVAVSPLQGVLNRVTTALLTLGGLNPTAPIPAPGNLIQLALYSTARWLQDTFNPGGIPTGSVTVGAITDPVTGAVTFRPVFTAGGAPLVYKVSVDSTLGQVSVNGDGVYTFVPTTATTLGAPAAGGSVQLTVIAYNGVQNTRQIIHVPIGPPTLAPITIPVGGSSPTGLALGANYTTFLPQPVESFAYVTNHGGNTVSVIDTSPDQTEQVEATINVGTSPEGVAIIPCGCYTTGGGGAGGVGSATAYVANSGSGTVSVIDTATATVTATIPVGTDPFSVAGGPLSTPAAGRVYVANFNYGAGNTVSVIDTVTNTVTATVHVGTGPAGVAVSPNGTHLYVDNLGGNTVSVISTATNTATATIHVGNEPAGVAVSPDGTHLYVTNFGSNTVSVISTATNTVTATVPVGASPFSDAVSPDGSVVYVLNSADGTVSAINTATNKVLTTINAGDGQGQIAVSPDGTQLYVPNPGGDTVSVISV